ncbi:MAG TPA: twin-arginine translocase TatA/TatE family subunit, partial [Mycobacteriales bacterium]|nr:twin-arginine translocase TatA/TatE family subunit [Mycobacteriales bacterium]
MGASGFGEGTAPVLALSAPGFWEWVFLAVLALLVFGPERLPKMAQSAGEMIARFKREAAGTLDELCRRLEL